MLNLNEREEEILGYWKVSKPTEHLRERNRNGKKFYFLDGPPNAYGLATHHIWVLSVKDVMLKYMRYQGRNVHDRPGFDVHGLPIENRIERRLNLSSKGDIERYGIEKFVKTCMDYVNEEIAGSMELMQRFAVHMDYGSAYLPYKKEYMDKSWGIFSSAYRKGLVYRDLKPLAYCPHCETVLSAQGPEVEYAEENDKSIFVRFKIDTSKRSRLKFDENTYLVIWTTTPWTLPANMCIAINPGATYVCVGVGKFSYIVAKDRLDAFAEAINDSVVVKSEFSGTELEGLYYTNPLERTVPVQRGFAKYHRVLNGGSMVSLDEGTGLLHVAPGHGPEDYQLAKANRIKIFSPIDSHAKYTEEAGEYRGLGVPVQANEAVLRDLNERGDILCTGTVRHTYPHCWRCHSKLIYRATDQWFINISKIKKKMLSENEKIAWMPQYAQKWFADAIESSPDWCISRQRYWATPIPIWICEKCSEMLVVDSVGQLAKLAGLSSQISDLNLHKPHIDAITISCTKCNGAMRRVPDVFDVWYDSGSSHTSSLSEGEFRELYPADWITESLDQIRGWFATLLRTGVIAHGKTPFKRVTIGGMMKNEFGEEMHRSHGNAVSPNDILKSFSADGFRLFCLSKPRWQDLKLKEAEIKEADSELIMLYNISELVKEFSDLCGYDTRDVKKPGMSGLGNEDLFIISRINSLIEFVTSSMNSYGIDPAINAIRNFVVEDFSRFYLKFAKQRANEATKSGMKRIANIAAYLLHNVIILESIATPFAAEYIYQKLFSRDSKSIFLEKWPKASKKLINTGLEKEMEIAKEAITAILNSREKAGVTLRWPIANATLELTDDESYAVVQRLSPIVESYVNAKHLVLKRISGVKKEIKPVFARIGPDFKDKASAVAEALKGVDAGELIRSMETAGRYSLNTRSGPVDIKAEHFTIVEKAEQGDATLFRYGIAHIDKNIPEELKEEALVREFERGVQLARRELGLKKADKIELGYEALGAMAQVIKKNSKKIVADLNAPKLLAELDSKAKVKDLDVEGESVRVSVKRL